MAPNLRSSDYYEILGCPRSADDSALKKAYRKLAVKWHPDKNPDNEEATRNFQKISEAYATLSDPNKRKLYDQYGIDGVNAADQMGDNAGGGAGFPSGFGFRPGGGGTQHHSMSSQDAEAFFAQFFGNDDPFGGFGGMGGPSMHMSMGGPGGRRQRMSGGADPISMMFGGMGGPGMGGMRMGGMPGGGMPGGGMGGFGAAPRQQKRYDAIPRETVVSLKGLINRPDRNGDRGVIQRYNPQNGRYEVLLEDSEEKMSVKPSNLLQHVQVRLHGIGSKPELNGKTGTILAWNSHKERYNIYVMALSQSVSLKPSNVILNDGTVGQIVGLMSKPELNNKWGTIKSWQRDSGRYDVQLSADKIIRVKVENIRV